MASIKLYTIGFTKTGAEAFFAKLKASGVRKVIDVRLNNVSQLAGFAKRDDLVYFLREILDCEYEHRPEWAPSKEILDGYKKKTIDWPTYAERFNALVKERMIENDVSPDELDKACLLCSEPTTENCHRRLVAEYLENKFPELEILHL